MNRKERQLQQRRMVIKFLIMWGILGIIGFVWLVYTIISWLAGLIYGAPEQTPTSGEYLEHVWTQEEALQDGVGQESAPDLLLELYEANKELLVLVNREHALEEGAYVDSLRSICNGRLKASDYLYEDLVDLLAAADAEGHQYWIASAYRSRGISGWQSMPMSMALSCVILRIRKKLPVFCMNPGIFGMWERMQHVSCGKVI